MSRRRSLPWIHRYSRLIMGAIAVIGSLVTAYLTVVAFSGGTTACPIEAGKTISSCDLVLQSSYAKLWGLPLSLFGLLAYLGMTAFALAPFFINPETNKLLRKQLEDWTWRFLLIGGTAMVIFSGYLMYISFFKLNEACIYCLTSAACSLALFVLSIIGREWPEVGQVLFTSIIVAMVTLVGTLGIYANATAPSVEGRLPIPQPTTTPQPPYGWEITTASEESELALAKHLQNSGAKMYSAFWCPHCYEQKQLFGKEAFKEINSIECDPAGKNPQTQACIDVGIKSYPTWEIKGQFYRGTQSLDKLAEITKYQGPQNFKYAKPGI